MFTRKPQTDLKRFNCNQHCHSLSERHVTHGVFINNEINNSLIVLLYFINL